MAQAAQRLELGSLAKPNSIRAGRGLEGMRRIISPRLQMNQCFTILTNSGYK
jgi:hypothetical protein